MSNLEVIEIEKQVVIISEGRGVQGAQGVAGISGTTLEISGVAGEGLSALRAVGLFDTGYMYVSSNNILHRNVGVGITKTGVILGDTVTIVTGGILSDVSWNWDTTKPIYLGNNGILTQTEPTTGFSQVVAQPVSSKKIRVVFFSSIKKEL